MKSLRRYGLYLTVAMTTVTLVSCTPSGGQYTPRMSAAPHRAAAMVPPEASSVRSETAKYAGYSDNPVKQTAREPLSTFSLDMDTASYANVRRFLKQERLPPASAVRVEELLNYFPRTAEDAVMNRLESSPFQASYELAPSPWDKRKTLLSLSVRAADVSFKEAPPANLVFLVDVSGSMGSSERLPLVKKSLEMLVEHLRSQDRISLVTYAGSTRVVLEPTSGSDSDTILDAIRKLDAGGGTAGGAGLKLAYEQAGRAFIKGGVNRILLCTDGDFNVGVSSQEEIVAMVMEEKEKGITLSTFGFGTDNLNDSMMSKISNVGNGNYNYIDSVNEAKKVLTDEMSSTLVTVAKDAKAQIEFNPAYVKEYRQIGYEKRQLSNEHFNDDAIDAGDIGAGKHVTVLYELTLTGQKPSIDPLRYSKSQATVHDEEKTAFSNELGFLKLRWKEPNGRKSEMVSFPITRMNSTQSFQGASSTFRFNAAVAAFGQKLRNVPSMQNVSWSNIQIWAKEAQGDDPGEYRRAFVGLVGDASRAK